MKTNRFFYKLVVLLLPLFLAGSALYYKPDCYYFVIDYIGKNGQIDHLTPV
jgi:hypothetical protein